MFNSIGGMCYQGILFPNTRIPPQYLASSLTQLYGIACLFTTICPTLTRQSRLFQTGFVAIIATIELIAVHFLAKPTIFDSKKDQYKGRQMLSDVTNSRLEERSFLSQYSHENSREMSAKKWH